MLTLNTCRDHVNAVLGGAPLKLYSSAFVANYAGRWLVNAHPWEWTRNRSTTLSLTAGQAYVDLPALRSVRSVVPSDNTIQGFEWTSLEGLIQLRNTGISPAIGHFGAIRQNVDATTGEVTPRLELWPTPSATVADYFTVVYDADWAEMLDDDDRIPIPAYMEDLFLACVIEVARAFEMAAGADSPTGLRLEALYALRQSDLWRDTAKRDGMLQRNLGRMEKGAAESATKTGTIFDGLIVRRAT